MAARRSALLAPLLLVLLIVVRIKLVCISASGDYLDHGACDKSLGSWAQAALQQLQEQGTEAGGEHDHNELKELLFFLHVPRTGGRMYSHCLLRKLFAREHVCNNSYAKFRYNSSSPCRLLTTHNDYSVLSRLPRNSTSVITNMRDPVSRIVSAYDFSISVACRVITRVRSTRSSTSSSILDRGKMDRSINLNIWPWRFLVPLMQQDLMAREDVRPEKEASSLPEDFSHYNASAYVMPLHDFIHHPLAMDLLNNGATFQIAGITNISFDMEATLLKKCVIAHKDLGYHVLDVAKRRLDRMLFVGVTDKYDDIGRLFARRVWNRLHPVGKHLSNSTVQNLAKLSAHQHFEMTGEAMAQRQIKSRKSAAARQQIERASNVSLDSFVDIYGNCASAMHKKQIARLEKASRRILPMNFSTEARQSIARETIASIRELNWLDVELFKYAQALFEHQDGNHQGRPMHFSQAMMDMRVVSMYLPWLGGGGRLSFQMLFAIVGATWALLVCLFVVNIKQKGRPRKELGRS